MDGMPRKGNTFRMEKKGSLVRGRMASPWVLAAKVVLVIFAGEFFVMGALDATGLARTMLGAWLDAFALGALASVALWFWIVRPLVSSAIRDRLFAEVMRRMRHGVVVCEPAAGAVRFVEANPAFLRMLGWDAVDLRRRSLQELEPEAQEQPPLVDLFREAQTGEVVRVRRLLQRRNGEAFWADVVCFPILEGDFPHLVVALVADVSEEVQREGELLRFRQALDQAEEAVCIFSSEGQIEYVNEAFVRCVGALSADDVRGKDALWLFEGDEEVAPKITLAMLRGAPWKGRFRARRLDGSLYEADGSIAPVREEGRIVAFIAIHRDVTEEVQLEQRLVQQQKMEAVGALVAGIAHDFNNTLAGMLGNLFVVRSKLLEKKEAALAKRIEEVETQGYRAAGAIRQLLNFARKQRPAGQLFPVKPFLKELLRFARPAIPASIELKAELAIDDQVQLHADPALLQQALLNLFTNARHAIEQRNSQPKGRILLRASVHSFEDASLPASLRVRAQHSERTDWLCLAVEDNGCGMDRETLKRVFEPFFTTKPEGVGTGLGLPMVRNFVENLGGEVTIESELGVGTIVRLYLPCLRSPEIVEGDAHGDVELCRGRGELVLVADDDAQVRTTLADILRANGYRVIEAQNGKEAKTLLQRHGEQIQAAILDIVMPYCDGVEVAQAVHRSGANIAMLFLTGYDATESGIDRLHALLGDAAVVFSKPYRVSELLFALRRRIDQRVREGASQKRGQSKAPSEN